MKRCVLTFGALGLVAAGISYAILRLADDTVKYFHVRLIALAIWPTGLLSLANEGATSSVESGDELRMGDQRERCSVCCHRGTSMRSEDHPPKSLTLRNE